MTTPSTSVKDERRWMFALRHGERVDLTYGEWVPHCFDENGKYLRKDLNLPLKLGERAGGKDSYIKDTPLTRMGRLQTQLVGEGLRLAGIKVTHVYASAALRCVETAHAFLEGLQADPSVKIRVEPGLFEYKMWYLSRGMPLFMTPTELHEAGLNVDVDYQPYIAEVANDTPETLQDFYNRGERVMQSAVKDTENEGGNIIFVGHATTLDMMTIALKRLGEDKTKEPYKLHNDLIRVPYSSLAAVRNNPWQVVCPPCPPAIYSVSGRYDWKTLHDVDV